MRKIIPPPWSMQINKDGSVYIVDQSCTAVAEMKKVLSEDERVENAKAIVRAVNQREDLLVRVDRLEHIAALASAYLCAGEMDRATYRAHLVAALDEVVKKVGGRA